MKNQKSQYVTPTEAAKIRGVHRDTVHGWLQRGLRSTKIGNQIIIDRADLDAFTPRPKGNPQFSKRDG